MSSSRRDDLSNASAAQKNVLCVGRISRPSQFKTSGATIYQTAAHPPSLEWWSRGVSLWLFPMSGKSGHTSSSIAKVQSFSRKRRGRDGIFFIKSRHCADCTSASRWMDPTSLDPFDFINFRTKSAHDLIDLLETIGDVRKWAVNIWREDDKGGDGDARSDVDCSTLTRQVPDFSVNNWLGATEPVPFTAHRTEYNWRITQKIILEETNASDVTNEKCRQVTGHLRESPDDYWYSPGQLCIQPPQIMLE